MAADGGVLAAKIKAMPGMLLKAFGIAVIDFRRPPAHLATNFLYVTLGGSLMAALFGAGARVGGGRVVRVARGSEGNGGVGQSEPFEVAANLGLFGCGFDEGHPAPAPRADQDVVGPGTTKKVGPVHARLAGEESAWTG
jgi:hypothetical protein